MTQRTEAEFLLKLKALEKLGESREIPKAESVPIGPIELMQRAGIEPDPWQREVCLSDAKRIIVVTSRQAGKSTTISAKALSKCISAPDQLVLLVSKSQKQSMELLRRVMWFWWEAGEPIATTTYNKMDVEFENRSRIISLPANPDTARGYSANLIIIDEAAFAKSEMLSAVSPIVGATNGELALISTFNGRRGFFWKTWDEPSSVWKKWKVPATDCPRLTEEFLEEERKSMGWAKFAQEYLCEPAETTGSVFSDEDIQALFFDNDDIDPFDWGEEIGGGYLEAFSEEVEELALV